MFHAILSTFKFFWKNNYLIGTDGPVNILPARSDFAVFIYYYNIIYVPFWVDSKVTNQKACVRAKFQAIYTLGAHK